MENINGYFKLAIKPEGIYVRLFPPVQGGDRIDVSEIAAYLAMVGVHDYDMPVLNNATKSLTAPREIRIVEQELAPVNERVKVFISNDNMVAKIRAYPPSKNGKLLTKQAIIEELVLAKIKFGLIDSNIDEFLANKQYCTDFIVAKGVEPVFGNNAEIKYNFKTDKSSKPTENEDGSVDFHKLDLISRVKKGDVVAVMRPVDYGKPGIDVLGGQIKPPKVSNKTFKHGKDITVSPDGLKLITDVSGHVSLEGDKVFVSNVYEVPADVDNSTGDVTFDGNVHVKGNVRTGFSIHAKGDIEIDGVVEGATLVSEGQIILKRGIQGMNRGKLIAGSNVIAKFIESSVVKSGGYIRTDAILHSKVSAKGDVIIDGKNGSVTGGELRSGTMISVKTAGSTMGTSTLLEVGIDPGLIDEYHEIEKEIPKIESDYQKIEQIVIMLQKKQAMGEVLSSEKKKYLQTATINLIELKNRLKICRERYGEIEQELENMDGGKVKISNIIYPGVKIIISNVVLFVRAEQQYCQFVRDRGDIVSKPL